MLFLLLVIYHCFALNCVDLKKVGTLTFRQGHYTVGGRTSSVPQLTCVENCANLPQQVNCYNIGNAYDKDPTWKCYSHGKNVVFSKVQVICESCRHKYDSDVLDGSCSLEYGIYSISDINHQGNKVVSLIFAVLFIFLIMMILSQKENSVPISKVCAKDVKNGVIITNRPVKSATRKEEDLINIFSGIAPINVVSFNENNISSTRRRHDNTSIKNVSSTRRREDIFNKINPINNSQRREDVKTSANDVSSTQRREDNNVNTSVNDVSTTQRREDNDVSSTQRREDNNVNSTQRREDNNVSSTQRREDNNVSSTQRREVNDVSTTQRREDSINWLKELYG